MGCGDKFPARARFRRCTGGELVVAVALVAGRGANLLRMVALMRDCGHGTGTAGAMGAPRRPRSQVPRGEHAGRGGGRAHGGAPGPGTTSRVHNPHDTKLLHSIPTCDARDPKFVRIFRSILVPNSAHSSEQIYSKGATSRLPHPLRGSRAPCPSPTPLRISPSSLK